MQIRTLSHPFVPAFVVGCLFLAPALRAAEPTGDVATAVAEAAKPPVAEQSVTDHRVTIDGRTIAYRATAGTLILRNDTDAPIASVGYFAYVATGGSDPAARPITFAFNGGPGSSSIWLHMGALGPRRVVTTDAGATPPAPYGVVDNAESLLDVTDLVMIDPVGTGFSKAEGKSADKDFWGVDPDIDEVTRFIVQYVTDNGRWNSPKFLLGESYGTTRGAGIVDLLQQQAGTWPSTASSWSRRRSTSSRSSSGPATNARTRCSSRPSRRRPGTTTRCPPSTRTSRASSTRSAPGRWVRTTTR